MEIVELYYIDLYYIHSAQETVDWNVVLITGETGHTDPHN